METIIRWMSDVEYRESDVRYLRAMGRSADPVVTAPELAEMVDVTQQAAHARLEQMRERGLVKKKQVGARSVVWWLTTDGLEAYRDSND